MASPHVLPVRPHADNMPYKIANQRPVKCHYDYISCSDSSTSEICDQRRVLSGTMASILIAEIYRSYR